MIRHEAEEGLPGKAFRRLLLLVPQESARPFAAPLVPS